MNSFISIKTPVARKPHKCFLCGGEIPAGKKYIRQTGVWENEFFSSCFHENCDALIAEFCKDSDDNEYTPDWVYDWIYNRVCVDCESEENCKIDCAHCQKVLDKILKRDKEDAAD